MLNNTNLHERVEPICEAIIVKIYLIPKSNKEIFVYLPLQTLSLGLEYKNYPLYLLQLVQSKPNSHPDLPNTKFNINNCIILITLERD